MDSGSDLVIHCIFIAELLRSDFSIRVLSHGLSEDLAVPA